MAGRGRCRLLPQPPTQLACPPSIPVPSSLKWESSLSWRPCDWAGLRRRVREGQVSPWARGAVPHPSCVCPVSSGHQLKVL